MWMMREGFDFKCVQRQKSEWGCKHRPHTFFQWGVRFIFSASLVTWSEFWRIVDSSHQYTTPPWNGILKFFDQYQTLLVFKIFPRRNKLTHFLLQHKWVQCQIFFTIYPHTHTPPVLKIVDRSGNETFGSIHIQENLSSAPGTRPGPDPTLGGVTKVYIFALSHSNFPRGHDGRVRTWYIWDIYTTGAFASIRTYTYLSNQAQTHFSSFIFIPHNGVSGYYLLLARGQVVLIFCRTTFAACRGLGWAHWFLVVAWLVQAEVPRDKPGHCK